MKTTLRPQQYYYLYSPFASDPVEMIKYTIQGLCATGEIDLYYRSVLINKNEKYPRKRLFGRIGANYKPGHAYSLAEKLILDVFLSKPELRFYEIRNAISQKLDDKPGKFRSDYVGEDVKALGLYRFLGFLTPKGRLEKKACASLVDRLEKEVSALLSNRPALDELLDDLGPNIILVDEDVLKKLDFKVFDLDELNVFFAPKAGESYGSYGGSSYYGGSGGYSGGGGGGWGGFGGGSFGGGGSGGSW